MRRCDPPAPAPFAYFTNCPQRYVRACTDGTGMVTGEIAGATFFVKKEEGETDGQAQARVDEYALKIARGRALNKVLYCNTLSAGDLAGCGLVDERPTVVGCNTLCTESGLTICTENGDTLAVN